MSEQVQDIPAVVFDWMMDHDFDALGTEQQQEVLRYFSPEEYQSLRHTSVLLAGAKAGTGSTERRASLLSAFDKKHPAPAGIHTLPALRIWQAAAAVFCIAFITLAAFSLKQKDAPAIATTAAHTDTVILTREVAAAPVVMHDTIILQAPTPSGTFATRQPKPQQVPNTPPINNTSAIPAAHIATTPPATGVYVVRIHEAGNRLNTGKGNSMQDDTVTSGYHLVSL